ncbi:MAG: Sapep family Mn(2+)-dependent dipeptidase [Firmicutes bacterium]|nr:Sapep family Mn(2+)-dependent dipeptidase [Bacillota bacterium]
MNDCEGFQQRLAETLDALYPSLEQTLIRLISFPTVKGTPAPGQPFGRDLAEALDFCLRLAASWGFSVYNVDGYCGVIDWPGENSALAQQAGVGVLGHIDVVPAAAADWRHSPWQARVEDGNLYGRGATDDKGPTLACLFAMKALADMGLRPPQTVRLIIGLDEENGFRCIQHYLQDYPPPKMGFVPDARFPLVCGEKGIIHWRFTARWQDSAGPQPRLLSADGGEASNIIPAKARARFVSGPHVRETLAALIGRHPQKDRFSLAEAGGETVLTAFGKAAHASMPERGVNAIALLFSLLASGDFAPAGASRFLATAARLYADDKYGATLGIQDGDSECTLTASPTLLHMDGGGASVTTDCRFPVRQRSGFYKKKLQQLAEAEALEIEDFAAKEPMYTSEDSPLAQTLLSIYRRHTGDDSPGLIIGGGTFARAIDNFLAFGPESPHTDFRVHQNDEYIPCAVLRQLSLIYGEAIWELANL